MAAAKAGVEGAVAAYNIGRQIAGGVSTLQAIRNVIGLLGNEEQKEFEPHRDPYDDNDIPNSDAIVADDSDRVAGRPPQPGQAQSIPETDPEDVLWRLNGQTGRLEEVPEDERLINYRPEPGEQLRQHVRNYLLFEEAHQHFSRGDLEDMSEDIQDDIDESSFEAVSVGDDDAQALLSDFGEDMLEQQDDVDIRRVDPQQARTIHQMIRRVVPNVDRTTARRLTKAVMILAIAKQVPFADIYNFISGWVTKIWEWIATHPPRHPPQQPTERGSAIKQMLDQPLPPQCRRRIFYRDGRLVSVVICSDSDGVRYYE